MFTLSQRSLDKLQGVNEQLVQVVKRAIEITKIDFAITEGLRSAEKQLQYFNEGKSQIASGGTHCAGRAVDTMAYHDSKGSWNIELYDDIADAMKQAAIDCNVGIRWGGAWHIKDIRTWDKPMQDAFNDYIAHCKRNGMKPFIDAVHFELA